MTTWIRSRLQQVDVKRALRQLAMLVSLVLVLLSARSSLADHYYVPSGSMLPTLDLGDRVFVNKAAYGVRIPFTGVYLTRFGGPERGDVVILESPEDGETLIKRVVAVPGDRVSVLYGAVVVDGQAADLHVTPVGLFEALGRHWHALTLAAGGGPDLDEIVVPDGQYLVVGDNRGDSHDGRMFGFVDRAAILGQAVAVYYSDGGFTWYEL